MRQTLSVIVPCEDRSNVIQQCLTQYTARCTKKNVRFLNIELRLNNSGSSCYNQRQELEVELHEPCISMSSLQYLSQYQILHLLSSGFLLHKTPTCLLLRSDGQFEAFGFEAVSKYNDFTEDEAQDYFYFDRFKMKLYDNKVCAYL